MEGEKNWETEERGGGENRMKGRAIEDREEVKEEVMQAFPSSQVPISHWDFWLPLNIQLKTFMHIKDALIQYIL